MPDLLHQEIGQSGAKCENCGGNHTGHSIWISTQQGDIEEREFVGRVTERPSDHGADNGTKWPAECENRQDDRLVRRI